MEFLDERVEEAMKPIIRYAERNGYGIRKNRLGVVLSKQGQKVGTITYKWFRSRPYVLSGLRLKQNGRFGNKRNPKQYKRLDSVMDAIDEYMVPLTDEEDRLRTVGDELNANKSAARDARRYLDMKRGNLGDLLFRQEFEKQDVEDALALETTEYLKAKRDYDEALKNVDDLDRQYVSLLQVVSKTA